MSHTQGFNAAESKRWVTGIDLNHYQDYLVVDEQSPWELWLLFLHLDGEAKDTPEGMKTPTGLYGELISHLKNCINHEHSNHGRYGMVYWAEDSLKKIAPLEVVGKIIRRGRKVEVIDRLSASGKRVIE